LAADEPLRKWQLPIQNAFPGLEPAKFRSDVGPEFLRLFFRFFVEPLIFLQARYMGLGPELLGGFENALLLERAIDICVR